jgi:predicted esterase
VTAPHEHHLTVTRTARYYTLGEPRRAVWIVAHGYGELAAAFAAQFAPVDDGTRLIVAPEGLSRFYHPTPAPGPATPATTTTPARPASPTAGAVGASWMTREDRESEIADQVVYLDAVHDAIFARVPRDSVRLTVLGFSQGVATVSRWLTRSRVPVDRLVCWAGVIPDEALARLRGVPLTMVAGSRDVFAPPERVAEVEAQLAAANLAFRQLTFTGGHRLDDGVLRTLAAEEAPEPPIGI